MKKIYIKEDIYDNNGLLIIAKGKEILLTDAHRKLLSMKGVLNEILKMEYEDQDNLRKIPAEQFNRVQYTHETKIESDSIKHEIIVEKLANIITSKMPALDNIFLKRSINRVTEIIYDYRDRRWYGHFRVLMNYVDWLYAHSINTAIISAALGAHLGYSDERLNEIALGAILHDIGMILLPSKVLNKSTKLTEAEMYVVRNHCELGYAMLQDTELSEITKKIILQHHEKNDGSGYPNGFTSIDILEEAKIVMIAEVFDTATSYRPYKEAISSNAILDQMISNPHIYEGKIVKIIRDAVALE